MARTAARGVALACLIWALQVRKINVVSDRRGLRVEGPDAAALPWDEVREVRDEVREVREVREVATVRQWQHEAFMAREYPERL